MLCRRSQISLSTLGRMFVICLVLQSLVLGCNGRNSPPTRISTLSQPSAVNILEVSKEQILRELEMVASPA